MTNNLKEILGPALLNEEVVTKKKSNRKYISRALQNEIIKQLEGIIEDQKFDIASLNTKLYKLKRENYKLTVSFNAMYNDQNNERLSYDKSWE